MEPNDAQLRDLLREWQAPPASPALEQRILARTAGSGWRFLFRGYIRVPVPVACAVAVAMMMTGWWLARQTTPAAPCITAATRICTILSVCRS